MVAAVANAPVIEDSVNPVIGEVVVNPAAVILKPGAG
jgi:hypothetical protein